MLLPHLHDHPLTLKRYPDGVEGKFFYEKQSPRHRPDWVETVTVYSRHSRRDIHYTLCQDLPTLVWLANLADIELHPSLSKAEEIERPATLAFDLDPGPPATHRRVLRGRARAARACSTSSACGRSRRPPARRGCRSTCL